MGEERKFRIGEVARQLNVETYVLRFWEKEFPQIDPCRTVKGQRYYTETQITLIRKIQQLLHEEGMTIAGARRLLEGGTEAAESDVCSPDSAFIQMLKEELTDIRKLLARPRD